MHYYQDLISIFRNCFFKEYNTLLIGGSDEPLYLPANEDTPHNSLFFTHDYFASALHECSHWLIAGEKRRRQLDFGYWYVPDGRTSEQQTLFQSMEVKPQAMEWILSMAAGHQFRISIDNLSGQEADTYAFQLAVYQQVKTYCEQGLSKRAQIFRQALCHFYKTPLSLNFEDFRMDMLF